MNSSKSSDWSNLASVVFRRTYARKDSGNPENWDQTIERVIGGNVKGLDVPEKEVKELLRLGKERKAIPAGRGLWFSGSPAHERMGEISNCNCFFLAADHWSKFVTAQDLLMCGGGVGMSVEHRFVSKFPKIKKDVKITHKLTTDADFIVPDSREGWCELTRRALESWFVTGKSFSYSTICVRGYGEPIKGFGGVASGPVPMRDFIENLCGILSEREGKHLRPIDAMDIVCSIGQMVVAGNVRRSAIIILGDPWDREFLRSKRWSLGNIPSWRAFANLTVVAEDIEDLGPAFWKTYEDGEPFGIFNRKAVQKWGRIGEAKYDNAIGTNPCGEATLQDRDVCNLQDIALPNIESEEEFVHAARLMHRYGKRITLKKFHDPSVDETVKRNRRIGTGITGCLASPLFNPKSLDRAYQAIQEENRKHSKELGIPESIRTTVIKPSGCRPWNALTTTDKGLLTLEELFIDHKPGSTWTRFSRDYNVSQDGVSVPVTATYDNGIQTVADIYLEYGLKLTSTLNHPWFVVGKFKKGKCIESINDFVETKNIEPGMVFDVRPGAYSNTTPKFLDRFFPHSVNMREDCSDITCPDYLSDDLCWFFGYLWGDGAQSPAKYRIRFVDANADNLEKVRRVVSTEFGLPCPEVKPLSDREANSLEISSKALWHWMIKNGVWKYQVDGDSLDLIPQIVRESSRNHIISFFSGLLDSDGAVGVCSNDRTVTLSTHSEVFAEHVQSVGWSVGLAFDCSHNTVGENFQERKSMYLLTLSTCTLPKAMKHFTEQSTKCSKHVSDLPWRGMRELTTRTRIMGKVKRVEVRTEPIHTYDIEVAGGHWFYAGAVKSHNTVSKCLDMNGYEGVHPAYSRHIIQRIRFATDDPLVATLKGAGHHVEPVKRFDGSLDQGTSVVDFYVKAPDGYPVADEDWGLDKQIATLEMANKYWSDQSTSVTIYYKLEEIPKIKEWLANNLSRIKTVSFLLHSGHGFIQAPKEPITKEQYEKLSSKIKPISFDQIADGADVQLDDCAGGVCPIK